MKLKSLLLVAMAAAVLCACVVPASAMPGRHGTRTACWHRYHRYHRHHHHHHGIRIVL
ncbi:MAG: hypothetical protein ACLQVD_22800 [Capsulimonadaceae bacterium]